MNVKRKRNLGRIIGENRTFHEKVKKKNNILERKEKFYPCHGRKNTLCCDQVKTAAKTKIISISFIIVTAKVNL